MNIGYLFVLRITNISWNSKVSVDNNQLTKIQS